MKKERLYIKVYNREKGKVCKENQLNIREMKLLYHTVPGRILLKLFFTNSVFSKISGYYNESKLSVRKIEPFIRKNNIVLEDFEEKEYKSFQDLFTRKIKSGKRQMCKDANALISVADARLTVYPIGSKQDFKVKGNYYTVSELLKDSKLAQKYKGGMCLIFRLTLDDYHRYVYFDDGKNLVHRKIDGKLHTVNPIAAPTHKVYYENAREYSIMKTKNFGMCIFMEIGAMQVGKVVNHSLKKFNKGQEKGYFKLGGSSIALIIPKDMVQIDDDILKYSRKGIETKVKMGEQIGVLKSMSKVNLN